MPDRGVQGLDYKDLEVFAAVAEAGSIRAAALRLGLSQPSVSQRMTRLERVLGTALLERSTRGVVVTPTGRMLLPFIDRSRTLLDEMVEAVRTSHATLALSVWTDATLAPFVMPFVCASLGDLQVELSNRVAPADQVLAAVEHGPADAAFAPRAPAPTTISSVPFFTDRLALVVHPDHPIASGTRVDLHDLTAYDVAVGDWGTATDRMVDELHAAGIPPDRLRLVSPASTAAMLALYCGHVGISARSNVAAALREGLLVELDVDDVREPEIEIHLLHRASDAERDGIRTLRAAVTEVWSTGQVPDLPRPISA